MARIVNMGPVLPEDIDFRFPDGKGGTTSYIVPGDPPMDLILKIAHLNDAAEGVELPVGAKALTKAQKEEALDRLMIEKLDELDAEVLHLLRIRQPDLDRSPFGPVAVQHFVAVLLEQFKELAGEADEDEDPTKAKGKAAPKPRPTRSSGSRS